MSTKDGHLIFVVLTLLLAMNGLERLDRALVDVGDADWFRALVWAGLAWIHFYFAWLCWKRAVDHRE